jgi:Protein of unknown function (DUF3631)
MSTPASFFGEPQQAAELLRLSHIVEALKQYIWLSNPEDYVLLAAWVVGTHLHKSFDYFGYLLIDSPIRECGKSTLMKILDKLVWKSSGLLHSPTEATMFRMNTCTQLLDEGDGWQNVVVLRNILNAGFQKGAIVARCGDAKSNYVPIRYPVYIPRAIAGIGLTAQFPETIIGRSFHLAMARQKREERRKKFRLAEAQPEFDKLRASIETWVKENHAAVEKAYRDGCPLLDGSNLSDRTRDVGEPLFAVLAVLSPDDRLMLLKAVEHTRNEDDATTDSLVILRAMHDLGDDPVVGNAGELAMRLELGVLESGPERVSRALRSFGFRTKSVRLGGDDGRKRYSVPRAELDDLLERYECGSRAVGENEPNYHS